MKNFIDDVLAKLSQGTHSLDGQPNVMYSETRGNRNQFRKFVLTARQIGTCLQLDHPVVYNSIPRLPAGKSDYDEVVKFVSPFVIVRDGSDWKYKSSKSVTTKPKQPEVIWYTRELTPAIKLFSSYLIRNFCRIMKGKTKNYFERCVCFAYNSYKHDSFYKKSVGSVVLNIVNSIWLLLSVLFNTQGDPEVPKITSIIGQRMWNDLAASVKDGLFFMMDVASLSSEANPQKIAVANAPWRLGRMEFSHNDVKNKFRQ